MNHTSPFVLSSPLCFLKFMIFFQFKCLFFLYKHISNSLLFTFFANKVNSQLRLCSLSPWRAFVLCFCSHTYFPGVVANLQSAVSLIDCSLVLSHTPSFLDPPSLPHFTAQGLGSSAASKQAHTEEMYF